MEIIIHRGTHQIGGTCIELKSGGSRIILDAGLPITEEAQKVIRETDKNDIQSLLNSGIIPKVKGLFKESEGDQVDALLISHAHSDHYGLLKYVRNDVPVYTGKYAKELVDITALFLGEDYNQIQFKELEEKTKMQIGNFNVTPFIVDHSAYDSYAFLIEAEGKKIVYTGDFRKHGRRANKTEEFINSLPNDLDYLITEGTNVFSGSKSDRENGSNLYRCNTEAEVEVKALQHMKEDGIPIFVCQSSQNIDRYKTMYQATKKSGRLFVIDIYTAQVVSRLSDDGPKPSDKYKIIKVYYPQRIERLIKDFGRSDLLDEFRKYEIKKRELEKKSYKICMLIRSSMLSDFKYSDNFENSIFIYSLWDGYLKDEKMKELIKFYKNRNMQFVGLHTSGHLFAKDLEEIIQKICVKTVIPVHTSSPTELAEMCKRNGKGVRVLRDGEILTI